MLTSNAGAPFASGAGRQFAIVASRYNARFVDGMLDGALRILKEAGAPEPEVVRVPGSWEIPVTAAAMAHRTVARPNAILCLGVILQGETSHARHIGDSVSAALMQLAMESGIAVVHEVLTVTTEAQAEARCLDPRTNRGAEAARTALEMAAVLEQIA